MSDRNSGRVMHYFALRREHKVLVLGTVILGADGAAGLVQHRAARDTEGYVPP